MTVPGTLLPSTWHISSRVLRVHQGYIHLTVTWGFGYYIGQVDIPLKTSLNKFHANPCRINALAGSLVEGVGVGWYRIEFRIDIDMESFGYHIYMLY